MYIEPNSTIKIYHGVPLDKEYNHTLYFKDVSAQNSYFHGTANIVKATLSNNSYQRVNKGSMRVAIKADNIYDCNYLAFQNTSFGNKWFYGFITSIEYVNNETSEITYVIDVMQTYAFDVSVQRCFIERQHSITDQLGDNIQPEPIELGEYTYSDIDTLTNGGGDLVLIMLADEDAGAGGNTYEGIYSGAEIWAFQSSDPSSITTKLNSYIQKPEQVVGVYMCPAILIPDVPVGGKRLDYSAKASFTDFTLKSVTEMSQDFGGYEPDNKKLYTYPYNYLQIDNNCGQSLSLRFEFFDDFTPRLEVNGTFLMPVKLVLRPFGYKGYSSGGGLASPTPCKNESLTVEGYPLCSWNVDTYKAWVAQNAVPIVLKGITNTFSTNVKAKASGRDLGLFTNLFSEQYTASIQAEQCRGSIDNGNVNFSSSQQGFYYSRAHITKDYAQTIDNFFSMYGYATNKIDRPNTHSRPHWNYVKTNGCVIIGNAPADDISLMCNIYDKGITFWKNPSEVGHYQLKNLP